MELTSFTDYSLRVLMFLGANPERRASIDEMAAFYGISRHHLAKIVRKLSELGYVETARGKNGGMQLAVAPGTINLAELIKQTEPHLNLVGCFSNEPHGRCVIDGICSLKGILYGARAKFFAHLAQFTLEDVIPKGSSSKAFSELSDASRSHE